MLIDSKFIKFLFVGGLNTLFGYLIFAFFIYIGLHYCLAVFLNVFFGVIFNFFTTGRIVFKNADNRLFLKFILVYIFMWISNSLVLYLFNLFNFSNMYIAGFIVIIPSALITFLLLKYYVFYK
jgi:putative flippase GtrA